MFPTTLPNFNSQMCSGHSRDPEFLMFLWQQIGLLSKRSVWYSYNLSPRDFLRRSSIHALDLTHTRMSSTNRCTTSSHSVSAHQEREKTWHDVLTWTNNRSVTRRCWWSDDLVIVEIRDNNMIDLHICVFHGPLVVAKGVSQVVNH
jgi:hypothetical protein